MRWNDAGKDPFATRQASRAQARPLDGHQSARLSKVSLILYPRRLEQGKVPWLTGSFATTEGETTLYRDRTAEAALCCG